MGSDSVTLLFTDVEGSTRLLERLGDAYRDALREHHRVMREAISAAGGREVDTAGDSFFAVFPRPEDAVACAELAQRALAERTWPGGEALRVRMGIHAGHPTVDDGRFVGIDVHRAARVMAVAHGGQVLLTEEAVRSVGSATVEDLGYHRLKDLPAPERLFQLRLEGLESDFPPLRSLNRSNLPTPATPLVGRRDEVATALGMLAAEGVRLVTLLGPGGVGKTRLAIEAAAEVVTRYRDGVWIVPLAPISDPVGLGDALARTLEIEPSGGEPLDRTLIRALADRQLLLLLDNFEHLLAAAGYVAEVLSAAPKVKVLATSRTPLRIGGEHRMEVPPLPLEGASELFLQRARAVRPGLGEADASDLPAIERLCTRLDGLPLAIELAAARSAAFDPRTLEARLASRLSLRAARAGSSRASANAASHDRLELQTADPRGAGATAIALDVHRRCPARHGRLDLGRSGD